MSQRTTIITNIEIVNINIRKGKRPKINYLGEKGGSKFLTFSFIYLEYFFTSYIEYV